eukprot:1458186-Amphidinium_carterae.1
MLYLHGDLVCMTTTVEWYAGLTLLCFTSLSCDAVVPNAGLCGFAETQCETYKALNCADPDWPTPRSTPRWD